MGMYLNPGNEGFRTIRNSEYIDKSGLIGLVNEAIDTPQNMICVTRPRRFGKSYAAQMLCAYYDKSCDSAILFDDLMISGHASYHEHLNQYDVIYLDMTALAVEAGRLEDIVSFLQEQIVEELISVYKDLSPQPSFNATLLAAAQLTGNKFIIVIDEWDAIFREAKENDAVKDEYIRFLRSLFKSSGVTDRIIAAAYITGILPIKKYGTQSAMTNFSEYSMVMPWKYAAYIGFTESEVENLCEKHNVPFSKMKEWYDGYVFGDVSSVYNPNSVMQAIRMKRFGSFWTQTETYDSLRQYIDMDFNGLQQDVIQMLGGAEVKVNTRKFQNDVSVIHGKEDVKTLLIHLGYLAYRDETQAVHIPNKEIQMEFRDVLEDSSHSNVMRMVRDSERLIYDTVNGDEAAVAQAMEEAHQAGTAPLFYNNEQALRAVVKAAYIAAVDHYITIEELPSGKGYADIVFLPYQNEDLPAMVIELKWNQSVETALRQIKEKDYPKVMADYGGKILLVGISYDTKTYEHSCKIEMVVK